MRCLALSLALLGGCAHQASRGVEFPGEAKMFAPGIVSTGYSELRLTLSPDGRTALWFSRDRPGGAGGYDIWMSRRVANRWGGAEPVSFNSPARDFDPAFTADGKFVYFCSDRAGGAGGDDLWRVRIDGPGFGTPEHLGMAVNTAANEWAPMLSPDGGTLLFSSDGFGGAGRMDLFTSRFAKGRLATAVALPGGLNTRQDEFDGTFLADGSTVVFSRSRDLSADGVRLFQSRPTKAGYGYGSELPESINTRGGDTYAPMLDWSGRDRLTFTTRRPASGTRGVDVFVVRYRP
jgi:Tol biopolymer transport system component